MIAEKDFWLHISMRAKNLIVFLMTLYVSGIEIRSTVCQEAELPGYQRMDLAGTTRNLSAANALRPLQPIESEGGSSPIRDHETTKLQEAASRHGDDAGPSRKYEPIPLRQPDEQVEQGSPGFTFKAPEGVVRNTAVSLGLVLVLFLGVAWFVKRAQPQSHAMLPTGVVEVLGRVPISQKQQLQLVRMGPKLLLVSSSGSGMQTLGEISDPAQVEQMVAMCQANRAGGITQSFRQVMGQFENENVQGFLGDQQAAREASDSAGAGEGIKGRRRRAWT
ncbi:MAG: flagellar biosynthetic protein FliO [Planctomycetota bacterium]|nr:flagellar biosynthetic protein FliO [Planctomycetota bacterium]